MSQWLSQSEIDDLCAPLKQAAAQRRYLAKLGLKVTSKPSGFPVILRSDVENLASHGTRQQREVRRKADGPDEASLLALFAKKNRRNANAANT